LASLAEDSYIEAVHLTTIIIHWINVGSLGACEPVMVDMLI